MKFRAQKVKDRIWVQWRGKIYSVAADLKKARRSGSEDSAQDLVAPFSCKVLRIHVRNGQEVKKGDPVVVVEAMKMEYSYASPRDGVIEKVNAVEGQIMNAGAHFVTWR